MPDEATSSRAVARRVFVTGATGFVGRHVIATLVEQGYGATAFVRDAAQARQMPALRQATLVRFDLADANQECLNMVRQGDSLLHFAWGDIRDHRSLRHTEVHLLNSYRFIRKAVTNGIAKVIVTGTSWEYGEVYGPVSASTAPRPANLYGMGKHLLHQMLRGLQQHFPFELIWARLFYMYGEGDDPRSLVAQFDRALDSGQTTFDMSLGEQLYDFMAVEDGARRLVSLIEESDGTYNVCSGKPISVRRLLEQRMKQRNRSIALNLGIYPYRPGESIAMWGGGE